MALPPVDLPRSLENSPEVLDRWEYRPVMVRGHFLHMREMTLYSIGPDGKPGYDLFTPLMLDRGGVIIVNRGWVPEQLKLKTMRPQTLTEGKVTVTGVLRKPWGKIWYGPENSPQTNDWYYGDIAAMAESQNLEKVFPMYLYADKGGDPEEYPLGGRTRIKLVNNHLDYALTWFGLAAVLLIIYLVYHVRLRRDEGTQE